MCVQMSAWYSVLISIRTHLRILQAAEEDYREDVLFYTAVMLKYTIYINELKTQILICTRT